MPQDGPTTGGLCRPDGRGRLGALALAAVAALILAGPAPAAEPDARITDVSVVGTRREWHVTPSGALLCQGVTAEEEERPPPPLTTLDDAFIHWTFEGAATPFELRLRNLDTGAATHPRALDPGERQAYLSAADLAPLWAPRRPDRTYRVELQFKGPGGTQAFTVEAKLAAWFAYECRDGRCTAATWLDEHTPLRESFEADCIVPRVGDRGYAGAQRLMLHGRDGRAEAKLASEPAPDIDRAACFYMGEAGLPVRSVRLGRVDSPSFGIPPR